MLYKTYKGLLPGGVQRVQPADLDGYGQQSPAAEF